MAQTGYTPIQIYHSTTTTNAPSAGNLTDGELAINTADGKLFYKDNLGAVQVIGWKTVPASAGGTGQTSLTANNVILGNGTSAVQFVAPGTNGNVLTSNGTTWTSAVLPAGGLTYIYTTTPITLTDKQGALADTSGGAFTITLPATPATGAQVVVADAGSNWGTNNLTVGRNGSTIGGLAQDLVCDITGASVQLVYDGTTWEVYAQIGGNGGTAVTLDGVQTLTNKTISVDSNTLSGIAASSFVLSNASGNIDGAAAQKAIPAGNVVGTSDSQTLTNKTINGANNTLSVRLANDVTGTLPVANGGTGATSLTANNVLLGNGTSAVQVVAPGSSGNVLTSNGTTWTSAAPSGGGLTLLATLTPANGTSTASATNLSSYKSIVAVSDGISLSGSSSLNFAVSSDNGSTYSTAVTFTNASSNPEGFLQMYRTDNSSSNKVGFRITGGSVAVYVRITSVTGTVNAVQIGLTAAETFTGTGSIYIYGMN